jgi:hypothetical protein
MKFSTRLHYIFCNAHRFSNRFILYGFNWNFTYYENIFDIPISHSNANKFWKKCTSVYKLIEVDIAGLHVFCWKRKKKKTIIWVFCKQYWYPYRQYISKIENAKNWLIKYRIHNRSICTVAPSCLYLQGINKKCGKQLTHR